MLRAAPGAACVIGADIPGINRKELARAFTALGNHDAVFGPAPDGGYWRVRLKHPRRAPPRPVDGVRWSAPHAPAASRPTLPGYRIAPVSPLPRRAEM